MLSSKLSSCSDGLTLCLGACTGASGDTPTTGDSGDPPFTGLNGDPPIGCNAFAPGRRLTASGASAGKQRRVCDSSRLELDRDLERAGTLGWSDGGLLELGAELDPDGDGGAASTTHPPAASGRLGAGMHGWLSQWGGTDIRCVDGGDDNNVGVSTTESGPFLGPDPDKDRDDRDDCAIMAARSRDGAACSVHDGRDGGGLVLRLPLWLRRSDESTQAPPPARAPMPAPVPAPGTGVGASGGAAPARTDPVAMGDPLPDPDRARANVPGPVTAVPKLDVLGRPRYSSGCSETLGSVASAATSWYGNTRAGLARRTDNVCVLRDVPRPPLGGAVTAALYCHGSRFSTIGSANISNPAGN